MTRNDFSGEIMGGSSIGEILTVSLCLAHSRVVRSTCSSARETGTRQHFNIWKKISRNLKLFYE